MMDDIERDERARQAEQKRLYHKTLDAQTSAKGYEVRNSGMMTNNEKRINRQALESFEKKGNETTLMVPGLYDSTQSTFHRTRRSSLPSLSVMSTSSFKHLARDPNTSMISVAQTPVSMVELPKDNLSTLAANPIAGISNMEHRNLRRRSL